MEEQNEAKTFPFKCPFCDGEMLVEEKDQDLAANCPYCGQGIVPTRETPDLFPPSGNVKKQSGTKQNLTGNGWYDSSEEYRMWGQWEQEEKKKLLRQKQWEEKRPERNFAALKSYADYEIPKKKTGIPPLSDILIFFGAFELLAAFGLTILAIGAAISREPEETQFYMFSAVVFIFSAFFLFGVADILKRFCMLVDNSYHIIYLLEKMSKTPSEQKPDGKESPRQSRSASADTPVSGTSGSSISSVPRYESKNSRTRGAQVPPPESPRSISNTAA